MQQKEELSWTAGDESGWSKQPKKQSTTGDSFKNCYNKSTKASSIGKKAGRWTSNEHQLFVQGTKLYGRQWLRIE